MTQTPVINANRIYPRAATYNAVKIQINNPQANVPEGSNALSGNYNAVNIQVNNPKINAGKKDPHHKCIYEYPCAQCLVTSDLAQIHPVKISTLQSGDKKVAVPAPNVTTIEEQKETLDRTNFKGSKKPVEIVPPVEIKPSVDIPKTIKNLSNANFDIQAQQMEDIAKASMEDSQKAVPFIVTEVFSELINIVNKDSSKLEPPSEKQIEKREQIIINELVRQKSKSEGIEDEKIELPYKITEEDLRIANELSPMEQAERNKEYALYTLAILSKTYTDEVQRHTGNVVPLTELPGVSEIVDTLRTNKNPGIKVAAIDSLRYLNKPEYKDEIKSVLEIATKDDNHFVAENAAYALKSIEK